MRKNRFATITAMALSLVLLTGCAVNPDSPEMRETEENIQITPSNPDSTVADTVVETAPPETLPPETEPPVTEININFVGDLMLASEKGREYSGSFITVERNQGPEYFLSNFRDIFANDDWTVGNLECVFTDKPLPEVGKGYSPAYWYKASTSYTDILTKSSVEIVSVANNHSMDYGDEGYQDTKDCLDAAGVLWGDNDNVVVVEKDGFKIAMLLCTYFSSGNDVYLMKTLNSVEADYKIVYFHGGTERVHVPDGWKAAGCKRMIDAGADLVIGGHPHVLQPIESYNGKTIVHSLGNFCFGGSRRNEENRTIVFQLHLTVQNGMLTSDTYSVVPCYLYGNDYQPDIITDEAEIATLNSFLAGEIPDPM